MLISDHSFLVDKLKSVGFQVGFDFPAMSLGNKPIYAIQGPLGGDSGIARMYMTLRDVEQCNFKISIAHVHVYDASIGGNNRLVPCCQHSLRVRHIKTPHVFSNFSTNYRPTPAT